MPLLEIDSNLYCYSTCDDNDDDVVPKDIKMCSIDGAVT